jgi:hypothetical protein
MYTIKYSISILKRLAVEVFGEVSYCLMLVLIDLWKLVAKHVVQLAVLERVTCCRYTRDSQICVLPEQCSSGPMGHVIS